MGCLLKYKRVKGKLYVIKNRNYYRKVEWKCKCNFKFVLKRKKSSYWN